MQLFGWNLKSLWQTANQYRCRALLKSGRLGEAMESHQYMMDMIDENTRARCLNWSTGRFSMMSPRLHPHRYYTQVSRKSVVFYILPREMQLSLLPIMTGLFTYTQRQSTCLLVIPFLQAVVRQSRKRCYGKKHFLMRKRCGDIDPS